MKKTAKPGDIVMGEVMPLGICIGMLVAEKDKCEGQPGIDQVYLLDHTAGSDGLIDACYDFEGDPWTWNIQPGFTVVEAA